MELEFFNKLGLSEWVKKTISDLKTGKAKFQSSQEAVAAYESELKELASKYSLATDEFLKIASDSVKNNPDFDRAISLSTVIFALKQKA